MRNKLVLFQMLLLNYIWIFIDLKKAYDSVRREVLYNILIVGCTHETS
jgi:hypothetical protein